MADESKKPAEAAGSVKCVKCGKEVPADYGKQKSKGFVCNDCLKKAKKRNWILWILLILLLLIIIVGLIWCCNNKKSVVVEEVVEETPVEVEFDIANTTVFTIPVADHAPVTSLAEFKEFVEHAIEHARESGDNRIEIPALAIMFGFNSEFLTEESNDLIAEIAKLYNQTNKGSKFTVNGYTCNVGTVESNNKVSQQRAEAVKSLLLKDGTEESKVKTQWFGKSKNADFNLPHEADYRRVLIIIE